MAGMKIDFSEVQGAEALPEGRYECVVERVEVRESMSSDNNYLNWEFRIVDEEEEDRRIWIGTSLSPKALFTLKDVLVALGAIEEDDEIELEWDEEVDVTPKEGPVLTNPDVEGLPALVATTNTVYEGKERQDAWRSTVYPSEAGGAKKKSSAKKSSGSAKKNGAKKSGARKRQLR